MSNRKRIHTTYAAQLKAAHLQQIEILATPTADPYQTVSRFAEAAYFNGNEEQSALAMVQKGWSAAAAVWTVGSAPRSLFAHLPGCSCPVRERLTRGWFADTLIPVEILKNWRPSRQMLEDFARIQQEARI